MTTLPAAYMARLDEQSAAYDALHAQLDEAGQKVPC
jgi:hypothetical protein